MAVLVEPRSQQAGAKNKAEGGDKEARELTAWQACPSAYCPGRPWYVSRIYVPDS